MEHAKTRASAWLVFLAGGIYFSIFLFLLTNWLRYLPSLAGLAVLVVGATGVIGSSILLISILRCQASPWLPVTMLVIWTAGVVIALPATMKFATGSSFPDWSLHHYVRNGDQSVETGRDDLKYHLELMDPFSFFGRSYLVLDDGSKQRRVRIRLFRWHPPIAIIHARRPEDWCTLLAGETEGELELRTTDFLRKAVFRVNLKRGTAVEE